MAATSNFNRYLYYGVIVLISLIVLFFFPMLGSEVGLEFNLPNTWAGWVIWSLSNLASAGLNLLLFHAFVKQGKLNISQEPHYLEALTLLQTNKIAQFVAPRSPHAFHSHEYRKKGTSLVIFTLIGMIGLSNAMLTFNLVRFLTQAISLTVALVFGIIEMKTIEEYWTVEFLAYAKYSVQEKAEKEAAEKAAIEAAQTTHYQEITEITLTERTREIPIIMEEKNDNNT